MWELPVNHWQCIILFMIIFYSDCLWFPVNAEHIFNQINACNKNDYNLWIEENCKES